MYARIEKSSSRKASSRFEIVCSGRTTRARTAQAQPNQLPASNKVTPKATPRDKSPVHTKNVAMRVAAKPPERLSRTTLPAWVSDLSLQTIFLEPPIKRAAAQAQ